MKIGNNLLLSDCIKSDTAIKYGISNMPLMQEIDAMKILVRKIYDPLCKYYNLRVPITSMYRSEELNKKIGGSKTSQHCKGEAVDLDFDKIKSKFTNSDLFTYIKNNLEFDQLIWEFGNDKNPDWVHVSYAKSGNNRKMVLKAIKTATNKTQYISI